MQTLKLIIAPKVTKDVAYVGYVSIQCIKCRTLLKVSQDTGNLYFRVGSTFELACWDCVGDLIAERMPKRETK